MYTRVRLYLQVGQQSLSPLVVPHLDHGAPGFGLQSRKKIRLGIEAEGCDAPYLHEEDLADVAVLADQVKQTVAVHLAHGQVVDNHHAAPGGRT